METRSNRPLVLSVTGFLLVTLAVFTLWLLDVRKADAQMYLIRFSGSVGGLEQGSPVTFSGVPAGRVTAIKLDKRDPSVVLVTIGLDPEIPVVAGIRATIVRSVLGGVANISLEGARRGAPPILAKPGAPLPVIPAREGGFLGAGGDPAALVGKISRAVDAVSRNLGADQQQHAAERLAALADSSAAWSAKVARYSDGLGGTRGRIVAAGGALEKAGRRAASLERQLQADRGNKLQAIGLRLEAARREADEFGNKIEALRPKIRSTAGRQSALVGTLRSTRATTMRLGDTAQRIEQEGLGLFGSPGLPDYRPAQTKRAGAAKDPAGTDASQDATRQR